MAKSSETLQTTASGLKTGYYWVKKFKNSDWEIAQYNTFLKSWLFLGYAIDDTNPVLINPVQIKKFDTKISKHEAIYLEINALGLNESFVKDEFIQNYWGHVDTWNKRSFDAIFVLAKKRIEKDDIDAGVPIRTFKSITGNVTRVS